MFNSSETTDITMLKTNYRIFVTELFFKKFRQWSSGLDLSTAKATKEKTADVYPDKHWQLGSKHDYSGDLVARKAKIRLVKENP